MRRSRRSWRSSCGWFGDGVEGTRRGCVAATDGGNTAVGSGSNSSVGGRGHPSNGLGDWLWLWELLILILILGLVLGLGLDLALFGVGNVAVDGMLHPICLLRFYHCYWRTDWSRNWSWSCRSWGWSRNWNWNCRSCWSWSWSWSWCRSWSRNGSWGRMRTS